MALPKTTRRAKKPAKSMAHIGKKGRYVVVGKGKQILLQQWLQLSYVLPANLRSRRTGITLRPAAHDENGSEPIDGLLPPPVKTTTPRRSLRLQKVSTPSQSVSNPPELNPSQIPAVIPTTDASIRKAAGSNKGKKRALDLSQADETDDDERVESGVNGDDEEDASEQADSPAAAVGGDPEAEEPPTERRDGPTKPKPIANSAVKRTVANANTHEREPIRRNVQSTQG